MIVYILLMYYGHCQVAREAEAFPPHSGEDMSDKHHRATKLIEERDAMEAKGLFVLMLFPSSGRLGFDQLELASYAKGGLPEITPDCIAAMLKRENQLRLSEQVQRTIEEAGPQTYAEIIDEVQLKVANEFGLGEDGVQMMRAAISLWRDHPDISGKLAEIPMYIRYNRAEQGSLNQLII